MFLLQFTALKLFTSLSFLLYEIHLIIDCVATGHTDFYTDPTKKINNTEFASGSFITMLKLIKTANTPL